jgi:hypothetical protein
VFGSLLLRGCGWYGSTFVVEVVATVVVVTPRCRHQCGYGLSMGARCCRWVVGVIDLRYLYLDISGGGCRERKEDENEPRNIVVRFVTHRVRCLSSSSSLPSSSCPPSPSSSSSSHPALSLHSSVSPLLLLLVIVLPSGFPHRQRYGFCPCGCLPPSPDPPSSEPSSETNGPHPFGKGRGGLGCNLACEGAEGVLKEPTSLIRGEGLVAVLICEVGGVEGEDEGEDGGGGRRRE